MKKILLFFAAAVCAVASWAADEKATVSATVKSQTLEVALTNKSEDFVAFQMDITLPEGVTGVSAVELVPARLTQPGTTTTIKDKEASLNFTIAFNEIDATHVRVLAYNLENRAIAGNEGALFNVTFAGTPAANFVLDNVLFVTTSDLEEIKLQLAESVENNTELGDINKSGTTNGNDLIALVEIIKNGGVCPVGRDYDMNAANVNGSEDPVPNGNDLVALIEYLKSKE